MQVPRVTTAMVKRVIAVAVTLVVIFIVLLLYACLPDGEPQAAGEQLYQGVPLDRHLLEIDKEALEDAYRAHLQLLFSVWLKDDVQVVHRINNGLRIARHAYGEAAARIEERERALGTR